MRKSIWKITSENLSKDKRGDLKEGGDDSGVVNLGDSLTPTTCYDLIGIKNVEGSLMGSFCLPEQLKH